MIKWFESSGAKPPNPHLEQKRKDVKMEDNNAIVVQRNATICPPLEGGPKSLISRRGKNAMNSNQEPSPELGNSETCQGLLRRFVHKITNNNEISPHNDMNNIVTNLFSFPFCKRLIHL